MKNKIIFILLLALGTLQLSAQSSYTHYLDMAKKSLEAKDCDAAQNYYNAYKTITEKTVPSLEKQIAECKKSKINKKNEKDTKDKVQTAQQYYLDLGLPSGTLWKNTNESGEYDIFEADSIFGNSIPTKDQWEELLDYCEWIWVGEGYKVKGKNGNSIFLPAEGVIYYGKRIYDGTNGCYYTSSRYSEPFEDENHHQGWSPHDYTFEFDSSFRSVVDLLTGYLYENKLSIRLVK